MEEESSGRILTDADAVRAPPAGFRFSDYGYIGSAGIALATVSYLIWTCPPYNWLQSVNIHYYPSRYWAVVPVPNYAVVVTIVVAIGFYIGLTFTASPPPPTLKSLFDECSEELLGIIPAPDDYQLIENLPDI
ncbi:phosphatidylinositol N-acetylglucosaminyltransferase subunit P-like [Andrographis paniculata]|uniref:phosphatidylinositol N-acetylglucosaminyltransferase subunit P-like n=1 Tax=Andrographis paniculata TaxID=175694 RepID=UPI0021E99C15|nr:phosphatidylinositol N-acetylglucosaminyltransferase subunit P-like [Andrographis paniculata]